MSKILVTGSEGFIGSHLVERLVVGGHEVRAFCLYNSFNDIGLLKELPPHILSNIEIIMGDIRDQDSIENATAGIDAVFHLASLISIPYSYKAPESYIETNIRGTLNVLKAAMKAGVSQVIHTSTSEVYGSAQIIPMTEEHPLVGQSPYSASKIGADQIAYSFFCAFDLPVSIVRPFNAFGPRQSSRAIIPTIITQALAGNTTLKLGNVHTTRDFNYVKDTVEGMYAFLGNKKTFGEVINIGSGSESSILNVINIVAKLSGVDLVAELDSQRMRPQKSEVDRLCADNTKAQKILNWKSQVTLEDGLQATFDWFKNRPYQAGVKSLEYAI